MITKPLFPLAPKEHQTYSAFIHKCSNSHREWSWKFPHNFLIFPNSFSDVPSLWNSNQIRHRQLIKIQILAFPIIDTTNFMRSPSNNVSCECHENNFESFFNSVDKWIAERTLVWIYDREIEYFQCEFMNGVWWQFLWVCFMKFWMKGLSGWGDEFDLIKIMREPFDFSTKQPSSKFRPRINGILCFQAFSY